MSYKVVLIIVKAVLFYVGHVCALENLALNKPTWQEHPWPDQSKYYGSEKAVDGLYTDRMYTGGQCTINADGYYTAEWRVDLGNVLNISYIKIFYRTLNQDPGSFVKRMAGFYLYISNITSKDSGHLCYKDETRGSPSVNQIIHCPIYGRYVIYYNERSPSNNPSYLSQYAYNELCEVEVYGYRGSYGDCCQNPCPHHCRDRECDAYTGHCRECMIGYYGNNCSNKCSTTCNVAERCDKISGRCDGGCKPGWTGNTCDQMKKCKDGYFGFECRSKCGQCLEAKHCHRTNGSCLNGCSHGYRGDYCNETCPSGLFGLYCTNRCDTYCTGNESCDPVTGICSEGCKKGWSGLMCGLDVSSDWQLCSDNTPIVIGVALSIVIVLFGSVINFIFWRRKTVINAQTRYNQYNPKTDHKDKSSNTSQRYTELGEVIKSNNYDELHNYMSVE